MPPSQRWSARYCAARVRARQRRAGRALSTFRANRAELHRSDPRGLIDDDKFDVAAELIARLGAALAPLERLKPGAHPLAELAKCHSAVMSGLGRDGKSDVAAFADNDGTALLRAFEELSESPSAAALGVAKNDYAELFHAAIAERVVRRPETRDVRVRIFGPLEARLQTFQRVVLGGLNEGTWPPETRSDPWLSRPMRADLGLDPPERRIGLAAHDLAQALGAEEVILSRAAKVVGSPTVASRFVQRIAALAGEARWKQVLARGNVYLDYARSLDHPAEVKFAKRPAPTSKSRRGPARFRSPPSKTGCAIPIRSTPNTFCSLMPLDPVDTPPGARDRGTVIHGAIGDTPRSSPPSRRPIH